MSNKNYDISWVSFSTERIENKKIKFFSIKKPSNLLDWIFTYFELKYKLEDNNYDILHVHSIGSYGLLGYIFKIQKKIYTIWGSDYLINKRNFFKNFLINKILRSKSLITTDAIHIKDEINKLIPECNVKLINFGVDVKKFSPKPSPKKNKNILISTRNLHEVYNIEIIIKAVQILISEQYILKLYIIGDGPENLKLKRYVKKNNLSQFIKFLGFVKNDKMPHLLNKANIYISASRSDAGLAGSTAEAMACGLICVVSDIYDNNKWIIKDKTGFTFKCDDLQDLIITLKSAILYNENKSSKIQNNARNKIITSNNYIDEMTKMENILKRKVNCNRT